VSVCIVDELDADLCVIYRRALVLGRPPLDPLLLLLLLLLLVLGLPLLGFGTTSFISCTDP
jgi:hypothetical protein